MYRDLYLKAGTSGPPSGDWIRPSDWLPMPDLQPIDNKVVALLLIWENRNNTTTVNIPNLLTSRVNIDWGDGTNLSNVFGEQTKEYDYSSISGTVFSVDGQNYKQVFLTIERDSVNLIRIHLNANTVFANLTIVDVIAAFEDNLNASKVDIASSIGATSVASNLERIVLKNCTTGNIFSAHRNSTKLTVLDTDIPIDALGSGAFIQAISLRKECGNIVINGQNSESGFRKFGNLTLGNNNLASTFINSLLEECGDITATANNTNVSSFFNGARRLRKVGAISGPIFNSSNMFQNCILLESVLITLSLNTSFSNFANNCISLESLVVNNANFITNTGNMILNCYSLSELILNGITIGFNAANTALTPQSLQDLFTSLGTANGSQTITLPTRLNTEPTTVATGKGWTIAYA
jgi:hypothetical protein